MKIKLTGLLKSFCLAISSCIALFISTNVFAAQPFTIAGSAGLNLVSYSTNKLHPSRAPFSYNVVSAFTISAYGIQLPFSLVYSEQERTFTQPFNQFGCSPKYKSLTTYLGYSNVYYSKFGLNGHTFLGAGFEWDIKHIRLGALYGRFDRAISSSMDSLLKPHYKRTGYAFKVGFGKPTNFIDFTYLHAKDAPNSITAFGFYQNTKPAENVVFGIVAKEQVKNHFAVDIDYGFSLYTADINAAAFTDYEIKFSKPVTALFTTINPRINTKYLQAMEASIAYYQPNFDFKINYRRIEPGYKSMGAYEYNSDLENITLQPGFKLFKKRVSVSGSLGTQHDNLFKTKASTSKRVIGSVNLAITPKPTYGVTAQYGNYSVSQSPGLTLINDTFRLAQVTSNASLSTYYTILQKKRSHSFLLMWQMQDLYDNNSLSRAVSNYQTHSYNFNYALNSIHTKTSWNCSFALTDAKSFYSTNRYKSMALGVTQRLLKNKLNTGLTVTRTLMSGTGTGGTIHTFRFTANFKHKRNGIRLNLIYMNRALNVTTIGANLYELTGTLGYVFTF